MNGPPPSSSSKSMPFPARQVSPSIGRGKSMSGDVAVMRRALHGVGFALLLAMRSSALSTSSSGISTDQALDPEIGEIRLGDIGSVDRILFRGRHLLLEVRTISTWECSAGDAWGLRGATIASGDPPPHSTVASSNARPHEPTRAEAFCAGAPGGSILPGRKPRQSHGCARSRHRRRDDRSSRCSRRDPHDLNSRFSPSALSST